MDENAPPGYLSPFGLLAGIRNMLPGGGKDLRTPDTESPNRPVLRDVNSSDGPKPKNLLNVAQGPEGSAPPSPASLSVSVTGDCSLVSSPGQERRSVASDTSFVSAVSEYGRAERPESDSSDSCFESSYVSAAESSGNISFLGDQFSKLVLNSPAPHSNFLNGSSEKPSVKSLNFWPGEELSADETITVDNGTAFGQIEREDPVDTLEEANSVTINNQTCSGSSYSDLDATFEDVHGNDDVNRTQILNEKSPSLENASEKNCLNGTEFVPVQSDHVEEASVNKTDPSSDESAVESGLNSTFTGNSETPSNISVGVEEVTVQACSEESVDSAQPITTENPGINVTFDGVPLGVEENSTGNETVSTEDLNNSEWRDLVSANQTFSPTVPCQDEIITTENVNVNVSADVVPVGVEENFTCSETINTEDLNNSEWRDLVSDSKFLSEEDVGQAEEEIDPTPSDNVNDCQDVPQHSQGADEIPLPIRKPRTFEEILAAELAAQSDPENAVPSFSDEIPIKKPRTFEEILAAELAAQSDPEQAAPSFPEKSETPSDINVTSVNVPVGEDTNLTEEEKHEASGLESVNSALPGPTEHSSINVAFDGVSAGDQKNLCKNEAAAAVDPVSEPLFHPQDDVCQADKETISHHSDAVSPEQDFPHHDQNADEIPLPIKTPRTFEEILAAELAAQSDPENAVPSFSDEIPLPIKKPRTFEEILAAELAAQSDPEQAVPSFSASPRKLDESFANIISADTSPLESECEPELVLDSVPAELDSEADSGLESLIQRAKQQEKDLEENLQSVSEEASQISSSYLNESERACSITSEELESPDCANQTVIELQADTSRTNSEVASEVQAQVSASLGDSTEGENFDAEEFESGDAFKDPSAFDFLSLHGCTRSARDLRKESLYVKFDPLVGSYTSDTRGDNSLIMHPENSSETQAGAACGQEQALNTSVKLVSLSPSASKQQAEETAQDATLITPIKTMPSRGTPVKTPAHIMLNETLESIGSRGTLVKQEDLIKKLQEHQAVLEEQDKAYQERISELEQRLQEMDIRRAEERDKEVKEKDKELQEKVQSLSELNVIMKEYEKTISRLVAEKSQEKAALEEKQVELVKDRDQAQQHLNNMEIAFSDIHTKYERLKSVVTALKKNEETLNAALAEKQENFDKMQNMYDMLKSHAVSKLEKANQDLESIKQKHQQENSKLKAMVKKLEVKTKSLEEALEQKVKENQALTAICDELINKVGE